MDNPINGFRKLFTVLLGAPDFGNPG